MAHGVPSSPSMTQTANIPYRSLLAADSFADAYATGFRLTVRFLLSKGASIDTAEELAQNAWARGWEAREQLRLEDRILPWINSIAYRRFCSDRRYAMRCSAFTDVIEAPASAPGAVLDAGIVLNLCSPSDRRILKQRYLEDMDIKEIAKASGLTETAVRVRIHRCRRSLRSRMTKSSKDRHEFILPRRSVGRIPSEHSEPCAA